MARPSQKRGESGKSHAASISFRNGGRPCNYGTVTGNPASERGAGSQRTINAPTAGSSPAEPAKLKRGRPTITAPRPWDSEGMSRRTWYRRKKRDAK